MPFNPGPGSLSHGASRYSKLQVGGKYARKEPSGLSQEHRHKHRGKHW